MKTIKLNKLIIRNFKGIKELIIDFKKTTNIFGANEAGKTTVFDAFNWLLFGKDSYDRKDFGIKNTVYKELNRQEHEVEGILTIDDEMVNIKRIYKEKWTKPKGATRAIHTGNEQEFFWNDVPMQAGQFTNKITEIVDETVFKLITNALYFNTLPWKKRREFLFKLAGEVSDEDVANTNSKFSSLITSIRTKGFEGYKLELNASKKKIKENLDAIPTRIDEASRALPENRDFEALEIKLKGFESNVADIDTLLLDKSKASQDRLDNIQSMQRGIHKIKSQIQDLRYNAESEFNKGLNYITNKRTELTDAVSLIESSLRSKRNLLAGHKETKAGIDMRTQNLRELFASTNSKELEFNENEFCCPTCKRDFEASDINARKTEMRSNFMADKNKALDEIEASGKALKQESIKCEELINTVTSSIESLEQDLVKAKNTLDEFLSSTTNVKTKFDVEIFESSEEFINASQRLSDAQDKLNELERAPEDTNVVELKSQKSDLTIQIDTLKKEINLEDAIKNGQERIKKLEEDEKSLAQQLSEIEGIEFNMDDFTRAKIELIEKRINGKFQHVTFKMYDFTIDGNPVETCETMYKGVPFSDLNTAGKVWAGIDVINTLSDHYKVYAPIFLDNRESVSLIPATDSQIINLIVSPEDKVLRVA